MAEKKGNKETIKKMDSVGNEVYKRIMGKCIVLLLD